MQQSDDQEEKEDADDEIEDEELIDEVVQTNEHEEGEENFIRNDNNFTARIVTLQMLITSGILQPGVGNMSLEYRGQKFIGDLLQDGKIKSQETDIVFASPSAWAIHCKRIINPEKKTGCGWASIKYKGQKLEVFKKAFRRKAKENCKENGGSDDEVITKEKIMVPPPTQQLLVKHGVLGSRHMGHDLNTLVECTPFSALGKIQPFLVSLSTNAALVMDFHCHLSTSEVVGYLAGHWDVNAHNLAVTHAFPCRSRLGDKELAPLIESDIYRTIEQRHLTLVGWYHSHPSSPAMPSLRDIDAQLEYQIRMKGNSDASYTPCIGIICSPYFRESPSLESSVVTYWVMPPPENKPHEFGRPMLMTYSVVQDQFLSSDALTEMKRCVQFYKKNSDYVKFTDKFRGSISYLEKLKATLTSKFPRDQSEQNLWNFVCELVTDSAHSENGLSSEKKLFSPLEIPSTIASTLSNLSPLDRISMLVPNIPLTSAVNSSSESSLLVGSELVNSLFSSGKFSSPSARLALAAESTRSLFGNNNLYVPPLSFKLDSINIPKPAENSVASPAPSTSKSSPTQMETNQNDSRTFENSESLDESITETDGHAN